MDIRSLRYFVAVYEERNLTAAARRCFISQPSVSAAVQSLEQDLETKLFIRHKKGMSPTAAAEQLYPAARRMIGEAEGLRALFRQPAPKRVLTLGLMKSLDIARTMELIRPVTGIADLHLRLVDAGEACDARFVSKSLLKKRETFLPLWTERYVVALPSAHPLAAKAKLRASDLAGAALVARCHCEHSELFARAGAPLETSAIAQTEEWALALVAAGVGIAFLPEGVARDADGVVTREIADVDLAREVGLAYAGAPSADLEGLIARLGGRRMRKRAA
jgi:DNA-binding transcriptional LysR family regulator